MTDPESLGSALEGASVVVNSVDYRFNLDVDARRASLQVRDYVDLGGDSST